MDNGLSKFPPYDIEFTSENDLTPVDLHYNFFEKSAAGGLKSISLDVVAGMSSIGSLLLEYTGEYIYIGGEREGGREGGREGDWGWLN